MIYNGEIELDAKKAKEEISSEKYHYIKNLQEALAYQKSKL